MMHNINPKKYPVPGRLNILLLLLLLPDTWMLLWMASHLAWGWALLATFLFAHFNNAAFSFLHEAVHGIFSRNRLVNEVFGVISAALFPTSFRLQQIAHLGHHRRNRTDKD
ncbi:MAG: fatty acid desaturase, partial [Candidatus Thiodiazotropha sp.]